jgi:hypothetical protein
MQLTKRPIMWDREGDLYQSGEAIQYEVDGLPTNGRTWIGKVDNVWKISRIHSEELSDSWEGEYASPNAALAFLEAAGERAEGSVGDEIKRGVENATRATVDELKQVLQNLHQIRRDAIGTTQADFIKTEIERVEKDLASAKEIIAASEKAEQ